jgi:hypothetical protein
VSTLLLLFSSPRTLADVLAESDLGDLETLTLLAQLIGQGWLVRSIEATPAPPTAGLTNPPLVLSMARFPTQPATPRAYRRWAVGLGSLALVLAALPTYLLAQRGHAPRAPATAAAALAQPALPEGAPPTLALAAAEPTQASGAEQALKLLATPPVPTPHAGAARAAAQDGAPPAVAPRVRRRAARPAAPAATSPGPGTAPAPSASSATSAPRMQLIEARRPQMQIVE